VFHVFFQMDYICDFIVLGGVCHPWSNESWQLGFVVWGLDAMGMKRLSWIWIKHLVWVLGKKSPVVHRNTSSMSPARGAERAGDQMHTSNSLRTCTWRAGVQIKKEINNMQSQL